MSKVPKGKGYGPVFRMVYPVYRDKTTHEVTMETSFLDSDGKPVEGHEKIVSKGVLYEFECPDCSAILTFFVERTISDPEITCIRSIHLC